VNLDRRISRQDRHPSPLQSSRFGRIWQPVTKPLTAALRYGKGLLSELPGPGCPKQGDDPMPKAEWGTKRTCPTTGKRFYDLNRTPIVSPYTGEVVDIESARRKLAAAVISRVQPDKDDALVDDLEADDDLLGTAVADDAEIDDDLLEDDADDNVSLDDLADVPGNEDDV